MHIYKLCEQVEDYHIVITPLEASGYEKKEWKTRKYIITPVRQISSPRSSYVLIPLILLPKIHTPEQWIRTISCVQNELEHKRKKINSPSLSCQKCHVLDVDDEWYWKYEAFGKLHVKIIEDYQYGISTVNRNNAPDICTQRLLLTKICWTRTFSHAGPYLCR